MTYWGSIDDAIIELESISNKTTELSNTIDNFKNIVNEKNEYEYVIVSEIIENTLYILDGIFKDNLIKIKYDTCNVEIKKINVNTRELTQVILNILNNSKDALLLNNKKNNRHINISCKEVNNSIFININDNAGGIANDILPKIFDPYFTTKHKSIGTGVGLYHCKKIIETNLHGSISINNINDGLNVTLEIPIQIIK